MHSAAASDFITECKILTGKHLITHSFGLSKCSPQKQVALGGGEHIREDPIWQRMYMSLRVTSAQLYECDRRGPSGLVTKQTCPSISIDQGLSYCRMLVA